MPTKAVECKASEERERAIDALINSSAIRSNTKDAARKINQACHQLDAEGGPLSIKGVIRKLAQMFSNDYPAESSIRNATSSGKVYRGVIEAWRTYQMAKKPLATKLIKEPIEADLSDSLLLTIQPEATRIIVLLMRTALRNTRRQFQLLQSLSSDRIVRTGVGGGRSSQAEVKRQLPAVDADVIKAFLDEKLCSARGVSWGRRGQLTD